MFFHQKYREDIEFFLKKFVTFSKKIVGRVFLMWIILMGTTVFLKFSCRGILFFTPPPLLYPTCVHLWGANFFGKCLRILKFWNKFFCTFYLWSLFLLISNIRYFYYDEICFQLYFHKSKEKFCQLYWSPFLKLFLLITPANLKNNLTSTIRSDCVWSNRFWPKNYIELNIK